MSASYAWLRRANAATRADTACAAGSARASSSAARAAASRPFASSTLGRGWPLSNPLCWRQRLNSPRRQPSDAVQSSLRFDRPSAQSIFEGISEGVFVNVLSIDEGGDTTSTTKKQNTPQHTTRKARANARRENELTQRSLNEISQTTKCSVKLSSGPQADPNATPKLSSRPQARTPRTNARELSEPQHNAHTRARGSVAQVLSV